MIRAAETLSNALQREGERLQKLGYYEAAHECFSAKRGVSTAASVLAAYTHLRKPRADA